MPLLLMWALGAVTLAMAPPGQRAALFCGATWRCCPLLIAALSLPILAAVLHAMRQLAPTRLRLAGAAAGSAAALVYLPVLPGNGRQLCRLLVRTGHAGARRPRRLAGPQGAGLVAARPGWLDLPIESIATNSRIPTSCAALRSDVCCRPPRQRSRPTSIMVNLPLFLVPYTFFSLYQKKRVDSVYACLTRNSMGVDSSRKKLQEFESDHDCHQYKSGSSVVPIEVMLLRITIQGESKCL